MPKKSGLGRGLDALIPGSGFSTEGQPPRSGITQIPVERISRNPRQPRSNFQTEELAELAVSIQEHGIIQPLIVRQADTQGQFVLIAGERRLLAARQAGLSEVPAVIRDASEQELVELALVENVQRADLSPLETAEAYRQLADDFQLGHEEIAARVGKSRTAVTNTLRLLKLPEPLLQALAGGQISEGHARALLALSSPQAQVAALAIVVRDDLNVRQTEALVRKYSGQRPHGKAIQTLSPEMSALEERLRNRLGTRVTLIPRGRRGGTLTIHYYSDEELNALVFNLLGEES